MQLPAALRRGRAIGRATAALLEHRRAHFDAIRHGHAVSEQCTLSRTRGLNGRFRSLARVCSGESVLAACRGTQSVSEYFTVWAMSRRPFRLNSLISLVWAVSKNFTLWRFCSERLGLTFGLDRLVRATLRDRQLFRSATARPLFDPIGRKPMIASTYAVSGVLLAIKSTGLFTPRIGRGLSRRRCGWMYRNSTSA